MCPDLAGKGTQFHAGGQVTLDQQEGSLEVVGVFAQLADVIAAIPETPVLGGKPADGGLESDHIV